MIQETSEKYAVIFVNQRTDQDDEDYALTANRMVDLGAQQEGYLGIYSVRDERGMGITISYWESEEAIKKWKENMEHAEAIKKGQEKWYEKYILQVCKVDKEYTWKKD